MQKIFLFLLLANTLLFGTSPPEGFTSLFNGVDLDGWWGLKTEDPQKWQSLPEDKFNVKWESSQQDIAKHWRVENGILINDGHGLYLSTEKNYGDFELMLEYKTVAGADSGIYLRGVPQIQIWDTTKEGGKWKLGADKGSGGLWNNGPTGTRGKDPLVYADKPFGQWNQFHVIMTGDLVSVRLNEQLVVHRAPLINYWDRKTNLSKRKPLISKGPIQLQTHGGEIRWKNIFIKELKSICCDEEELEVVFNGKNFEGWAGAVNNYEVVDKSIQCIKGKGGTIFTEEKYQDFVVNFEFKLPPGGNNGLAIRYPGKGNPAYAGMCELQVLDNEHARYAKLDPRQYHGSAYGISAAPRGLLKKTGEWNTQEVTVEGSRVIVILNGNLLLDEDLSKVDTFMANQKHPGLSLKEGHFGFAGHSDPVAFRNIKIKRI
ncbi:MAG: DUF1080 domain-containing protein [Opitutales bacterium]|jgi:hypothetical protein